MLSENPNATHIFENNLYKLNNIVWKGLSQNPNAIHILEKKLDKVDWKTVWCNPNIFYSNKPTKGARH